MRRRTRQQVIDDKNLAVEIANSERQEVFDLRGRVDFYMTEREDLLDDKRKLQQENEALQAKNDALVARVARLKESGRLFMQAMEEPCYCGDLSNEYGCPHCDLSIRAQNILNETESLAEHDAEVIEKAVKDLDMHAFVVIGRGAVITESALYRYASQLRHQAKP